MKRFSGSEGSAAAIERTRASAWAAMERKGERRGRGGEDTNLESLVDARAAERLGVGAVRLVKGGLEDELDAAAARKSWDVWVGAGGVQKKLAIRKTKKGCERECEEEREIQHDGALSIRDRAWVMRALGVLCVSRTCR